MSLTLKDSAVGDAMSQIDEIDHAIVELLSALVAPSENPESILHEIAEIASSSCSLRLILNDGESSDDEGEGSPHGGEKSETAQESDGSEDIRGMASALASRRAAP